VELLCVPRWQQYPGEGCRILATVLLSSIPTGHARRLVAHGGLLHGLRRWRAVLLRPD